MIARRLLTIDSIVINCLIFPIEFRKDEKVGERHLKRCESGGKEAIDHLVRKEQQNSRKRKVNMITKIENVKMHNGK